MNTFEEHTLNTLEEHTLNTLKHTLEHTLDHNGSLAHRLWRLSYKESL